MVSIISADYSDWCFQLTSKTYDTVLLVMSLAIITVLFSLFQEHCYQYVLTVSFVLLILVLHVFHKLPLDQTYYHLTIMISFSASDDMRI